MGVEGLEDGPGWAPLLGRRGSTSAMEVGGEGRVRGDIQRGRGKASQSTTKKDAGGRRMPICITQEIPMDGYLGGKAEEIGALKKITGV